MLDKSLSVVPILPRVERCHVLDVSSLWQQHGLERPHCPEGDEGDPVRVVADNPLPGLYLPLDVVHEHRTSFLLVIPSEVFVLHGRLVRQERRCPGFSYCDMVDSVSRSYLKSRDQIDLQLSKILNSGCVNELDHIARGCQERDHATLEYEF